MVIKITGVERPKKAHKNIKEIQKRKWVERSKLETKFSIIQLYFFEFVVKKFLCLSFCEGSKKVNNMFKFKISSASSNLKQSWLPNIFQRQIKLFQFLEWNSPKNCLSSKTTENFYQNQESSIFLDFRRVFFFMFKQLSKVLLI